jgi:hypothetical protein
MSRIEDMQPINELRMAARWKLGRALAKVERLPGGRGNKTSDDQKSFSNLLKVLDLDKSLAMEAQRRQGKRNDPTSSAKLTKLKFLEKLGLTRQTAADVQRN